MHIGKGVELHPFLKKLYDHSPHAVSVCVFGIAEMMVFAQIRREGEGSFCVIFNW